MLSNNSGVRAKMQKNVLPSNKKCWIQSLAMMKLIEETTGVGELIQDGVLLRRTTYRVRRHQGVMEGSGLPVPGLHRIEGSIDFDSSSDPSAWIGVPLTLKL